MANHAHNGPTVLAGLAERFDDFVDFRLGLELLIEQEGGHEGLALVGDGEETMRLFDREIR